MAGHPSVPSLADELAMFSAAQQDMVAGDVRIQERPMDRVTGDLKCFPLLWSGEPERGPVCERSRGKTAILHFPHHQRALKAHCTHVRGVRIVGHLDVVLNFNVRGVHGRHAAIGFRGL